MPDLVMWFDGSCPWLLCLEVERHGHPWCPDCLAVRYGNIMCQTCRQRRRNPETYPLVVKVTEELTGD